MIVEETNDEHYGHKRDNDSNDTDGSDEFDLASMNRIQLFHIFFDYPKLSFILIILLTHSFPMHPFSTTLRFSVFWG